MKAVVFGGAGFLGSHVADVLTDAGYHVRIFDLKPSPYIRAGQTMIVGDILDPDAVSKAVEGCDYVYNFAGIADLDDASTKPSDTLLLNVYGNTLLLDACVRAGCRRFIYASTIYVYGDKGGFYRCSKQASELYIEEYHRHFNLSYSVLRYGTLYGPRADGRNSIYRYLRQALKEKKISAVGTGDEFREYIHVRDAARLSVEILDDKYANTHVTLTGHHVMRFKDLLLTIREILSEQIEIEYIEMANRNHYELTPYSYVPKVDYKLTSNCYVDIGQGLIECLAEIDREMQERSTEDGETKA
ncbi:MAG: NAD(P)-dependent oxidoreductase [Proteobacteria bacterium]|nr:NAD(P)-dependent oxidoreductase [Pseudomonadota bacterium]